MTNAITLAQVVWILVAANVIVRMGIRNSYTPWRLCDRLRRSAFLSLQAFPVSSSASCGAWWSLMVVMGVTIMARSSPAAIYEIANGIGKSPSTPACLARLLLTFGGMVVGRPIIGVLIAASLS